MVESTRDDTGSKAMAYRPEKKRAGLRPTGIVGTPRIYRARKIRGRHHLPAGGYSAAGEGSPPDHLPIEFPAVLGKFKGLERQGAVVE